MNQAAEESLDVARARVSKMAEWADMFYTAPMSKKRMILAEIIDRIVISSGYKINILFKITAQQFMNPDADAEGDQKVS